MCERVHRQDHKRPSLKTKDIARPRLHIVRIDHIKFIFCPLLREQEIDEVLSTGDEKDGARRVLCPYHLEMHFVARNFSNTVPISVDVLSGLGWSLIVVWLFYWFKLDKLYIAIAIELGLKVDRWGVSHFFQFCKKLTFA